MSKEEILAAIQGRATELGYAPTFTEMRRIAKLNKHLIRKHFLTYERALAECGLARSGPGYTTSAKILFTDWAELARKLGKVPTMAEYEMDGSYSVKPLLRRYGGWKHVPEGLQAFAHKEGLESEWADVMEIVAGHLRERKARARRPGQDHGTGFGANSGAFGTGFRTDFGTDLGVDTRPKIFEDRPTFGRPWVRSPLSHAPTNEMGVVFLFGAMALDLGFVVSRLQMGYPDCEAMREVAPGIWQRVRIELEYESRNFLTHMHAPGGCDMIVCWRHNWPECPMEVVELEKYCRKWMM